MDRNKIVSKNSLWKLFAGFIVSFFAGSIVPASGLWNLNADQNLLHHPAHWLHSLSGLWSQPVFSKPAFKNKTTIKILQTLIESENEFAGSAVKNGMERINSFKESKRLNLIKLIISKIRIKYENSCGTIPAIIAKTMIISENKIVLIGFGEGLDIDSYLFILKKYTPRKEGVRDFIFCCKLL